MQKVKQALLPVFVFATIDVRRLFRDKIAIFFTFLFPLIFLFIFGGIFGQDSSVSFNVALIDQADSQFSQQFAEQLKKGGVLEVDSTLRTISDAATAMERSQIDAIIVLPPSFGESQAATNYPSGEIRLQYSKNNQQAGQALSSILESHLDSLNKSVVGTQPQPFTVSIEPTGKPGLSSLDYLFPGLVGFTILGLGLFGPTSVFPRLKQRGVLRRYHTTTLQVWQFVLGNVLSNSVAALLAVAVMIIVAITVPQFDVSIQGNILLLALFVILGAVVIFGIGLSIGGWAKNENQAAPLSNLVSFPMMFLSGTLFPRFLMPEWLHNVSSFLPLTPFIDGVRMIMVEGRGLLDVVPQFAMLAVWGIIIYSLAFRVFRWE